MGGDSVRPRKEGQTPCWVTSQTWSLWRCPIRTYVSARLWCNREGRRNNPPSPRPGGHRPPSHGWRTCPSCGRGRECHRARMRDRGPRAERQIRRPDTRHFDRGYGANRLRDRAGRFVRPTNGGSGGSSHSRIGILTRDRAAQCRRNGGDERLNIGGFHAANRVHRSAETIDAKASVCI
jgi:hypothetical protein